MITLVDDKHLKITVAENNSSRATLCFTGIGYGLAGIDVQTEEFKRSSQDSTSIFIVDKQRSWGNNLDFLELFRIVRPFLRGKTIYAIGNSMGGFLAILASRYIECSVVIALAPQYSVSKKIIPDEHRWNQYVNRIRDWRYLSLEGAFYSNTQYYIISGLSGGEDRQLKFFPKSKNIHPLYFTDGEIGHNIVHFLKGRGVLYHVIRDCFSGESVEKIIQKHVPDMQQGDL